MKKQFLTAALLVSAFGYVNANETTKVFDVPADVEVNAEASGTIKLDITIERGSNFCLSAGTGCTITLKIEIDLPFLMNVKVDRFDASYDGKTIDGFEFETVGPNGRTTYTVPTQVLNWNGDGFTMVYR